MSLTRYSSRCFLQVNKHSLSATHRNSCAAKLAQTNKMSTPMMRAMKALDADLLLNMQKLFNTAYVVAKENYAFEDFPMLCALQKKNGIKLNDTYLNGKAAKQFVGYIAESLRAEIKNELKDAKFFTLIADGSTDKSSMPSEIIYLNYLHGGETKCSFINLVACKDETAPGIKKTIVSTLDAFVPEWKQKLTAVSFDGASVNMGPINGVSTQLKDDCPGLIAVQCIAHKLELAVSDAFKKVKYIDTLEDMLKGIYSFYHRSTKRIKELDDLGDLMETKILRHKALHGIRWLRSKNRAAVAIINNMPCLIMHLEDIASSDMDKKLSSRAKGYLKTLKSERFVKFILLFQDITTILSSLSELFQRRYLTAAKIKFSLKSTNEKLKKMLAENGPALEAYEKEMNINDDEILYRDMNLNRNVYQLSLFEDDRHTLLQNLLDALEKRFDEINLDSVLGNIDIFDPLNIGEGAENESYGEKELKVLLENLPQNLSINSTEAVNEYIDYKVWSRTKQKLSCETVWQRFLAESSDSNEYTNLCKLLNFILILPFSTAECERGFSQLNLIKSDIRNRLSTDTVNDLLMVKLYGPNLTDFCPDEAINLWWNDVAEGRIRRPDFKK